MSLVPESPDSSSNSGGALHRQTPSAPGSSRYESQKRRDWNTFGQYLKNHRPPLTLSRCSGAHVLEFLRYHDQFGKTKVHASGCPFYGNPHPPAPCPCPLRQAWGSLDALIGRLRAAFEENGGTPEANPFGARAVRLYLRDVQDSQAKARGISYEKKKRKRSQLPGPPPPPPPPPHPPQPPQHQPPLFLQHHDMTGGEALNGIYNNQQPLSHHIFLHEHVLLASGGDVDGGLIPLSVHH